VQGQRFKKGGGVQNLACTAIVLQEQLPGWKTRQTGNQKRERERARITLSSWGGEDLTWTKNRECLERGQAVKPAPYSLFFVVVSSFFPSLSLTLSFAQSLPFACERRWARVVVEGAAIKAKRLQAKGEKEVCDRRRRKKVGKVS